MTAATGAKAALIVLLALAAAIMVVRGAYVAAFADRDPERASGIWAGHPDVLFRLGLARIGEAAASGQPIARNRIAPLLDGARKAPLAPEPYLIRGVEVRLAGNEAGAGRAFAEARRRDPRSIPARFFLADHYLRTNEIERGLGEVAVLTELVPGSEGQIAPILASYAQTPGAAPHVKGMLRAYPRLESDLLARLATDAGNADLIGSLASSRREGDGRRPTWQARLVEALVADGQHARAYAQWARLVGMPASPAARPLLFDPGFRRTDAMAPFAWTLVSGGDGLVEPDAEGLHVIYYGRADIRLASQTLLLGPGSYALAMTVSNGAKGASALAWTMTCLPAGNVIATLDLAAAAAMKGRGRRIDIPGTGCAAQRLDLTGKAPDFPGTVDLSLSGLRLTRGGS